ncbi:MAG: hypothetical protein WCO96_08810 [Actinomycetes bacterium]
MADEPCPSPLLAGRFSEALTLTVELHNARSIVLDHGDVASRRRLSGNG